MSPPPCGFHTSRLPHKHEKAACCIAAPNFYFKNGVKFITKDSQSNIALTKFESGKNEEDEENIKQLPDDYDLNIKDSVDFDEYKKSCPTVCPFRNNMVCAKCQHNIYRSFLSVCHLRSFSCKHPDEKLELIKRGPCVQASPFNNDLPKPKGKLIEPNDEDIVLKFINCRQNGKLYKNDPRCKFEDEIIETPAPE